MFFGTVSMTLKDTHHQRPFLIVLKEQTVFGMNIKTEAVVFLSATLVRFMKVIKDNVA